MVHSFSLDAPVALSPVVSIGGSSPSVAKIGAGCLPIGGSKEVVREGQECPSKVLYKVNV